MLMIALTGACQPLGEGLGAVHTPSVGYRYLDLIYTDPFDDVGAWMTYDGGDILKLAVTGGSYNIRLAARQYVWTQLPYEFDDILIEAEVSQLSDFDHNAFGIACRLDPANSGRGYYFLIGGDGHYSIRWSNGRSLDAIVSAKSSGAIKRGRSKNRVRAICVEDYLALWVNDQFVAETRDIRATEGAVGLTAVMNYAGRVVEVSFDDLKIWRSELDE